jgi:hypothetical protein
MVIDIRLVHPKNEPLASFPSSSISNLKALALIDDRLVHALNDPSPVMDVGLIVSPVTVVKLEHPSNEYATIFGQSVKSIAVILDKCSNLVSN